MCDDTSLKTKGLIGLANRGNTCFFNSALQLLSHIPELTTYFLNNEFISDLNNRLIELNNEKNDQLILTKDYAKLIKILWTNSTTVEPKTLHQTIQRIDNRFNGFEQHDSQEILSLIIDHIHDGIKYDVEISYGGIVKNPLDQIMTESTESWKRLMNNKYSIIADLFYGQYINQIKSLESPDNPLLSKTFEFFSCLTIPIYGKTLYDCLSHNFQKEILDTKYLYEKTNTRVKAYRQQKLMKIPKYLIITLKRYKAISKEQSSKCSNLISFPFDDLDLSSYADGYDKIECKLKLISIGCHSGGINGGHYYSVCKHINGNWYEYNDETVSEYNIEDEKKTLFKEGYILIYQRINE